MSESEEIHDCHGGCCQLHTGIAFNVTPLIYIKDALFDKKAFNALKESRLEIGHAFSLGLAFLIGASILKTILAPTWTDIGQLAAIIAIRTALNFFLLRDIESLFKK